MDFSLQPLLETEEYSLVPLEESDFEKLYEVASDPTVWEQHPNIDRYKREVFEVFFKGAIESKGAYKIVKKSTQKIVGSTRFYKNDGRFFIGYTFYGTQFWGQGINSQVKKIMLDYLFQYVDSVHFHVGVVNIRSQKALEKLGAEIIATVEMAYFGEETRSNYLYQIKKS